MLAILFGPCHSVCISVNFLIHHFSPDGLLLAKLGAPDLIGLCFASVILNVDARIALPRGLVDSVTCARLPRLSETFLADLTKVVEANPLRVLPHQFDDIVYRSHERNGINIGTTEQGWGFRLEPLAYGK